MKYYDEDIQEHSKNIEYLLDKKKEELEDKRQMEKDIKFISFFSSFLFTTSIFTFFFLTIYLISEVL